MLGLLLGYIWSISTICDGNEALTQPFAPRNVMALPTFASVTGSDFPVAPAIHLPSCVILRDHALRSWPERLGSASASNQMLRGGHSLLIFTVYTCFLLHSCSVKCDPHVFFCILVQWSVIWSLKWATGPPRTTRSESGLDLRQCGPLIDQMMQTTRIYAILLKKKIYTVQGYNLCSCWLWNHTHIK